MAQVATDIIIPNEKGQILLMKRSKYPFKGKWVLPGGHSEEYEEVEKTAVREAKEETGISIELEDILGAYSKPERDPRGDYISITFIAKPSNEKPTKNEEATEIKWINPAEVKKKETGFDHYQMIQHYLKWIKTKKTGWSKRPPLI